MLKFGRNYRLEVQGYDGSTTTITMPFTVQFAIQRAILATSQEATIRIFNLSQNTRNLLWHDRTDGAHKRTIKFYAGYGNNLALLVNGIVLEAGSYRQEGTVDYITEIKAWDLGHFSTQYTNSTIQFSNCSKQTVVNRLVSDLVGSGLTKGTISTFPGTHNRYSVCDNTWNLLKLETDNHCFIDNGTVHCLLDSDYISGSIYTISSATGLLGAPYKRQNILSAEVLFEPYVSIGQQVQMNSSTFQLFNGVYRINGLSHVGIISAAVNGKCKTIISMIAQQKIQQLIAQEV